MVYTIDSLDLVSVPNSISKRRVSKLQLCLKARCSPVQVMQLKEAPNVKGVTSQSQQQKNFHDANFVSHVMLRGHLGKKSVNHTTRFIEMEHIRVVEHILELFLPVRDLSCRGHGHRDQTFPEQGQVETDRGACAWSIYPVVAVCTHSVLSWTPGCLVSLAHAKTITALSA